MHKQGLPSLGSPLQFTKFSEPAQEPIFLPNRSIPKNVMIPISRLAETIRG